MSAPVPTRPTLLLVDDDVVFRERLARAFTDRGYEVRTAGDYEAAVTAARRTRPSTPWSTCACRGARDWS